MYIGNTKIKAILNNKVNKFIISPIIKLFTQQRTVATTGVVICNPIDILEVGEEYALIAYLLPGNNMLNDNLVKFNSSNPSVATIKCGVIKAISEGTTVITVKDYDSRIYSAKMTLTVKARPVVSISDSETYTVNAVDYLISLNGTNSSNTTSGIISALNYASSNGYKKIKFPYGTYLVTPSKASDTLNVIQIPSNIVIDFQNSIINIEDTEISLTGYNMFTFGKYSKCENSSIINANIVGEVERTTQGANNLSEHCVSVAFYDAENCGLDNCDTSYSPGFNIQGNMVINIQEMTPIHGDDTESGRYDENGNNKEEAKWWRTKSKLDISNLKGNTFVLGNCEGYQGYTALVARLYEICFYDKDNNFISKIENCLQFLSYKKPSNATRCTIAFHQTNQPSGNIGGSYSSEDTVACIYSNYEPYKCYIKKCNIHDNHDLGIAMTGGKRWLLENNTFSNNGNDPSAVNADIDYEDGWDSCSGDIIRNNTFNSNKGIVMLSSISTVLHDNIFNNTINAFGTSENKRVQFFRSYDNIYNNCTITAYIQNECVFAENIMSGASSLVVKNNYHTNSLYTVRMFDNVYS